MFSYLTYNKIQKKKNVPLLTITQLDIRKKEDPDAFS